LQILIFDPCISDLSSRSLLLFIDMACSDVDDLAVLNFIKLEISVLRERSTMKVLICRDYSRLLLRQYRKGWVEPWVK
jgi:hypothetical protein